MLFSILAVILIWEIASIVVGNEVKIPSPQSTLKALVLIVSDKSFFTKLTNTIGRVLISFSLSFTIAVVFGVVAGFFKPFYYLLKPVLIVQRSIPTMAVILLALIWLNREIAPVLVGSLIVFPIIYTSVVTGIRSIDTKLLQMTNVYKLDNKTKIKYLYLPSIKKSLISISSVAISLCIKVTIAAEVLSQPKNAIGTSFQMEKVSLNTAGVFAWAIIAITIASFFEYLISMKWRKIIK